MKALISLVVVTAALAAPCVSYAQQMDGPLTRAQVRAELAQFEKAGYNPGMAATDDYPANLQAAKARIAAQREAAQMQSK